MGSPQPTPSQRSSSPHHSTTHHTSSHHTTSLTHTLSQQRYHSSTPPTATKVHNRPDQNQSWQSQRYPSEVADRREGIDADGSRILTPRDRLSHQPSSHSALSHPMLMSSAVIQAKLDRLAAAQPTCDVVQLSLIEREEAARRAALAGANLPFGASQYTDLPRVDAAPPAGPRCGEGCLCRHSIGLLLQGMVNKLKSHCAARLRYMMRM